MIRLVVVLSLLILGLFVALMNPEPVTLKFPFGYQLGPLPLYGVVGLGVLVGALVVFFLMVPTWWKTQSEIRRLRRLVKQAGESRGPGSG